MASSLLRSKSKLLASGQLADDKARENFALNVAEQTQAKVSESMTIKNIDLKLTNHEEKQLSRSSSRKASVSFVDKTTGLQKNFSVIPESQNEDHMLKKSLNAYAPDIRVSGPLDSRTPTLNDNIYNTGKGDSKRGSGIVGDKSPRSQGRLPDNNDRMGQNYRNNNIQPEDGFRAADDFQYNDRDQDKWEAQDYYTNRNRWTADDYKPGYSPFKRAEQNNEIRLKQNDPVFGQPLEGKQDPRGGFMGTDDPYLKGNNMFHTPQNNRQANWNDGVANTVNGPRHTAWDRSMQRKLKGLHQNRGEGMNYQYMEDENREERAKYEEKINKLTEKRLLRKHKEDIEDAKKSKAEEKGVIWDENERQRLFDKLLRRSNEQEKENDNFKLPSPDRVVAGKTDELKDPRLMKLGRFAQSNIFEKDMEDPIHMIQKKSKTVSSFIDVYHDTGEATETESEINHDFDKDGFNLTIEELEMRKTQMPPKQYQISDRLKNLFKWDKPQAQNQAIGQQGGPINIHKEEIPINGSTIKRSSQNLGGLNPKFSNNNIVQEHRPNSISIPEDPYKYDNKNYAGNAQANNPRNYNERRDDYYDYQQNQLSPERNIQNDYPLKNERLYEMGRGLDNKLKFTPEPNRGYYNQERSPYIDNYEIKQYLQELDRTINDPSRVKLTQYKLEYSSPGFDKNLEIKHLLYDDQRRGEFREFQRQVKDIMYRGYYGKDRQYEVQKIIDEHNIKKKLEEDLDHRRKEKEAEKNDSIRGISKKEQIREVNQVKEGSSSRKEPRVMDEGDHHSPSRLDESSYIQAEESKPVKKQIQSEIKSKILQDIDNSDELSSLRNKYYEKGVKMLDILPNPHKPFGQENRSEVYCADCQEYIPLEDLEDHPLSCLKNDKTPSIIIDAKEVSQRVLQINENFGRLYGKISERFRSLVPEQNKEYLHFSEIINMILNCMQMARENDNNPKNLSINTRDMAFLNKKLNLIKSESSLQIYNLTYRVMLLTQEKMRLLHNFHLHSSHDLKRELSGNQGKLKNQSYSHLELHEQLERVSLNDKDTQDQAVLASQVSKYKQVAYASKEKHSARDSPTREFEDNNRESIPVEETFSVNESVVNTLKKVPHDYEFGSASKNKNFFVGNLSESKHQTVSNLEKTRRSAETDIEQRRAFGKIFVTEQQILEKSHPGRRMDVDRAYDETVNKRIEKNEWSLFIKELFRFELEKAKK